MPLLNSRLDEENNLYSQSYKKKPLCLGSFMTRRRNIKMWRVFFRVRRTYVVEYIYIPLRGY